MGSALVRALISRAQARGVTSLSMDVLPGNHQVLAMISAHWAAVRTHSGGDCVTLQAGLFPAPDYARSSRAKRRTSSRATDRARTTPALTASSVMVRASGTCPSDSSAPTVRMSRVAEMMPMTRNG